VPEKAVPVVAIWPATVRLSLDPRTRPLPKFTVIGSSPSTLVISWLTVVFAISLIWNCAVN
jgi:hypothetical protein